MNEPRSKGTKSAAVLVSAIGAAIILCVVGVTAIAAPKFMRFQNRSMQSECKSQLRAIATAERAYYADFDRYSPRLSEVGFSVDPGNRYQYRLGTGPIGEEAIGVDAQRVPGAQSATYDAALPAELRAKLGLKGTCPDCELTAACVGNLDSDDAYDVWSVTVSAQKDGERFMPIGGELTNHLDDTQL